jgi:zinc transport system ATP-binding protein
MMPAVSAEELSFRYNAMPVLSQVSFQLAEGDYLGLVGPNGSGKTTLIRLLLGFLEPAEGTILLFGHRPSEFKSWYKVGYLPQGVQFFNPHFPASVGEVVALGLISRKKFPRRFGRGDDGRVTQALELMDIGSIRDKLIGQLSGGQQQRVLIARALVSEPQILILDEPTTALDPEARERFFQVLTHLNESHKTTIIIITHDLGTIGRYASRLLYIDKTAVFFGSFDSFCQSPDMANYFGEYSQHLICHRHDEERQ